MRLSVPRAVSVSCKFLFLLKMIWTDFYVSGFFKVRDPTTGFLKFSVGRDNLQFEKGPVEILLFPSYDVSSTNT